MTITICLSLSKKREKVTLDPHGTTLEELHQLARRKFGLSSAISLRRQHVRLNADKQMTLADAKIQDRDLLLVVEHKKEEKLTTKNDKKKANLKKKETVKSNAAAPKWIPGLTKDHFLKVNSRQTADTPTLVSAGASGPTGFEFHWKAQGTGSSYKLSAKGDLATGRAMIVHCACVAFDRLRNQDPRNRNQVPVCKHLEAALLTVMDPTTAKKETKRTMMSDSDSSTSSSSEEENAHPKRHRPPVKNHHDDDEKSNPKKTKTAPKINTTHRPTILSTTTRMEAPIKLLTTPGDIQMRQCVPDRSHWCWSQCQTPRELVLSNSSNDTSSISFMAMANYLIEFENLKELLPELVNGSIPNAVIFHTDKQPSPTDWPATVDFQQLNPGADPNTAINPLRYKFPFGTHHTKMFLVGYSNKIRVVISTGNLRSGDHVKVNAAYVEEFPKKKEEEGDTTTIDFEETLVHYMESYGYHKQRNWTGKARETLVEALARYDYSGAKGVLIPSVPGYYDMDDHGNSRVPQAMGQIKLRNTIRRCTSTATATDLRPVVCQFSSIGVTSVPYLKDLQSSMDTHSAQTGETASDLRLKFVWPTAGEIRDSVEGYAGGGSVPGRHDAVRKPFLDPLWRKWTSSRGSDKNPLAKPNYVPHIKSYYQTNDSQDGFDWLVVTSHNISRPAWGTISTKNGQKYLHVKSWELGVFVSPDTVGVKKLVPFLDGNQAPGTATVPMPFQTHALERYSDKDEPWAWDKTYDTPDREGYHSLQEAMNEPHE